MRSQVPMPFVKLATVRQAKLKEVHKLTFSKRAEKRGMPQDKLERLYPNTFTLAQVRKLQGKSWDIPGPKGNKRLTEEEKKQKKCVRKQLWDAKQREKMNAPASSRSRRRTRSSDASVACPCDPSSGPTGCCASRRSSASRPGPRCRRRQGRGGLRSERWAFVGTLVHSCLRDR